MILDLSDFKVELDTLDLLNVILSHRFKGQEQFLIFSTTHKHFGFNHLFSNTKKKKKTKTNIKCCRSEK